MRTHETSGPGNPGAIEGRGARARENLYGTMVQPNIMLWSSCPRLWQWAT
jgi:hypothetical protein